MFQHLRIFAAAVGAAILLGNSSESYAADEADSPISAIEHLIDQLGSKRYKDREQAALELQRLGKSALPRLKEATNSRGAEIRRRAQQIVERIDRPIQSLETPPIQQLPVKRYL